MTASKEPPAGNRVCSRCELEKPASEFYSDEKRQCKECRREIVRNYKRSTKGRNSPSQRKAWADNTFKGLGLSDSDY
jgi:hypothetical protein